MSGTRIGRFCGNIISRKHAGGGGPRNDRKNSWETRFLRPSQTLVKKERDLEGIKHISENHDSGVPVRVS